MATPLPDFLSSEASLDSLIAGFEDGTWPIGKWTHAAHLTIGACCILEGDSALDRFWDRTYATRP